MLQPLHTRSQASLLYTLSTASHNFSSRDCSPLLRTHAEALARGDHQMKAQAKAMAKAMAKLQQQIEAEVAALKRSWGGLLHEEKEAREIGLEVSLPVLPHSPRLASSPLASPPLASPRLTSPNLTSPPFPSSLPLHSPTLLPR